MNPALQRPASALAGRGGGALRRPLPRARLPRRRGHLVRDRDRQSRRGRELGGRAREAERPAGRGQGARSRPSADLRAFAGDPRAAVGRAARPRRRSRAPSRDSRPASRRRPTSLRAWQALGAAQRLLDAAALLRGRRPRRHDAGVRPAAGARSRASTPRFAHGRAAPRSRSAGQIADEQAARTSVASELALAWGQFRAAPDRVQQAGDPRRRSASSSPRTR